MSSPGAAIARPLLPHAEALCYKGARAAAMGRLRVLTLNCWNVSAPLEARMAVARDEVAALVETPDGLLPVVTTHLDWEHDHGFVRERQVLALASLVEEWAHAATLPPIVAGDLNADPDSTEVRFLCGRAALGGQRIDLEDAWLAAGDGGPGFTWDNRNPYAAYAGEPDRRIDYILVGRPARVEAAALALDTPRDGVLASDHFGVVADVWLPGGTGPLTSHPRGAAARDDR